MAELLRRKIIRTDADQPLEQRLARTLSWPHLVALGVGAIVGTGILTLIGVGADRARAGCADELCGGGRDLCVRCLVLCRDGDDDPRLGQRIYL